MKGKSLSRVQLLATPWTAAYQAPPPMGFSREESWSGVPAQSCPALSDPMDCSLPGSSIHGIFQARVLEWGAIAFSVPRGKRLLILLLPSLSPVILDPKKIISATVSIFPYLFAMK